MIKRFWRICAAFAVLVSVPAAAETIRVPSHSSSSSPEFLTVQTISLGTFEGDDGAALSHMVEAQLTRFRVDGQPLFDVRVAGNGRASDAIVTGAANASVEKFPAWQKREICLEKDVDRVCLKYGDVPMDCLRRVVSTNVQLRFYAPVDGRVLLTNGNTRRDDKVICPDDTSGPRTVEEIVSDLMSASMFSILPQFSPYLGELNVSLHENTNGIAKADIKRFKNAIKLTQRNPAAGCAEFDAMYANDRTSNALSFNTGLCAENSGNPERAIAIYQNMPAEQHVRAALDRLETNRRALAEIAARKEWIAGRQK
jgi:hypothetical protein